MDKERVKNKKYSIILVIILLLMAFVIFFVCLFYVYKLKDTMQEETNKYLSEISKHVSTTINYRVNINFNNLETTVLFINKLKEESPENLEEFLKEESHRYGFIRMGISDLNGICRTTDGNIINVSENDFFKDAAKGKNNISDIIISEIDGQECIVYSVPIYYDKNLIGVLSASSSKESLKYLVGLESFGGEGYFQIIDSNGNFIVNDFNLNEINNFFDYQKSIDTSNENKDINIMKENIKHYKSGIARFALNDRSHDVLSYRPLGIRDWYILSIVPTKISTDKINTFVKYTISISAFLVLSFVSLIIIVLFIQNRNHVQLEKMAFTDDVTGGASRLYFETKAKELIHKKEEGYYAFVSLDINKFKLINDSFGSNEGNKTLKYILESIQKNLEKDEIVSRTSADNFGILMKYTNQSGLISRLEKICDDINSFNNKMSQKYYLNLSEGVYVIDDLSVDMITIQDRANVARKNNKWNNSIGLNSCSFYTDLERIKLIREKEMENRMETALNNNEFLVYLQPKYELEHNTIAGAEALVRWNDPKKGLIAPSEFIPVFEKDGFIVKIDLYVFEEVCKKIKNWLDNKINPMPISVNLSRVHLNNPDFLLQFVDIFKKYNIPPNLIEIELTETLIFENMELLINVIEQIHNIGFTCSLDDFGSGYSSLNLLKDVPVDVLKLDRAFFLTKKGENKRGNSVVESVIELAKKLEMHTVSEGVESSIQVDFLRNAKCDMVQGYVFSKPLPISEFELLAFGKEI